MAYETLSLQDLRDIARDALRAAESDHARISLDPKSGGGPDRVRELAERIQRVKARLRQIEEQVDAVADPGAEPAPVVEAPPVEEPPA